MRGGGFLAGVNANATMAADRLQIDDETGNPVLRIKLRNERWAHFSRLYTFHCLAIACSSLVGELARIVCDSNCCTFREDLSTASRCQRSQKNDEIDAKYGFERYSLPTERTGWLINMHPVRWRERERERNEMREGEGTRGRERER